MTTAVTAPATILAFSLLVVGRIGCAGYLMLNSDPIRGQ
ncbi:hypothetical protein ABIF69_009605 [Bradyrhizobium japonicum]